VVGKTTLYPPGLVNDERHDLSAQPPRQAHFDLVIGTKQLQFFFTFRAKHSAFKLQSMLHTGSIVIENIGSATPFIQGITLRN
jgi:hypothetical protein